MKPNNASAVAASLRDALDAVSMWRSAGESVIFTNGCFDLLHVGHLHTLTEAARHGDRLVVGINSDRSVRLLKGGDRPLVTQRERAELVGAFAVVDLVLIFDDESPHHVIEALQPDVLVKGGDYNPSAERGDTGYIVGSDVVRARGGQVVTVPVVPNRSTSGLLARLG